MYRGRLSYLYVLGKRKKKKKDTLCKCRYALAIVIQLFSPVGSFDLGGKQRCQIVFFSDNINAVIELCVIAFLTQSLPENGSTSRRQVQNPFISFANRTPCSILDG